MDATYMQFKRWFFRFPLHLRMIAVPFDDIFHASNREIEEEKHTSVGRIDQSENMI